MNSIARLILFLLICTCTSAGFCQSKSYDPSHLYSIIELRNDFEFLRTKLEKVHPGLYTYTSKDSLNSFLDSLGKSIVTPLTSLEFYNRITLLNSKIKDGHTMFLPGSEATTYYNQHGRFFPFYVFINRDRLFIDMNCSSDASIKEGSEILSINGISSADIIQQLISRQIRDGENNTYPVWILNNYFKEYLSFSFGHPSAFSLLYKNGISEQHEKTINALSKDSIKFYRQARYSNRIPVSSDHQGIVLTINQKLNTGILTIKSFDIGLLRSLYKQAFRQSIENAFLHMRNASLQNLVLDIRDNQGGDFEPGRLLLSYLVRRPLKYLENSKEYRIIVPAKGSYKGNLYILINGGTFSSTGIVSSYLELTKRGIFIGEEAAGNKYVISGNSSDFFLLNTGILSEISTTKYVIRKNYNSGHGVIPAFYIAPGITDIIENRDPVMEFALKLISTNEQD